MFNLGDSVVINSDVKDLTTNLRGQIGTVEDINGIMLRVRFGLGTVVSGETRYFKKVSKPMFKVGDLVEFLYCFKGQAKVKEVYYDILVRITVEYPNGDIVSAPQEMFKKWEESKVEKGDFVKITGKSLHGSDKYIGTIGKVEVIGFKNSFIDPFGECRGIKTVNGERKIFKTKSLEVIQSFFLTGNTPNQNMLGEESEYFCNSSEEDMIKELEDEDALPGEYVIYKAVPISVVKVENKITARKILPNA